MVTEYKEKKWSQTRTRGTPYFYIHLVLMIELHQGNNTESDRTSNTETTLVNPQ